MRMPIQYALTYPDRCESIATKLDWRKSFDLHFEPPDLATFGCLRLAIEAGEAGGILDTILQRLSVYVEKAVKLKAAVKSALIYPVAVVSV